MPDLSFEITGVRSAAHGLVPLLEFSLVVRNQPEAEEVRAILLQAQIQVQPTRRGYSAAEQQRLDDLFGPPERWDQTVRNRQWTQVQATIPPFAGQVEVSLPVPCSYDLNLAATKYFAALDEGSVSLLFLFSGTVFHAGEDGRLQVQRMARERECAFAMPVATWSAMMEEHYPNSAWLYLRRDLVRRLQDYRRQRGLTSWDETIEHLLAGAREEVSA